LNILFSFLAPSLLVGLSLTNVVEFYTAAFSDLPTRREEGAAGQGYDPLREGPQIIERRLQSAERAVTRWGSRIETQREYGRLLVRKAQLEENPEQRLQTWCRALSAFGAVTSRSHLDPQALVAWANIRQMLGDTQCALPFTQGDFRQSAELALSQSPQDPKVGYAAGLVLWWSDQRERAFEVFRGVLAYDSQLSEGQRATLLSLVTGPTELKALLPARFPQVLNWSMRLVASDVGRYRKVATALAEIQNQAISTARQDLRRGALPESYFQSHLLALLPLAARDRVRQRIDAELAENLLQRGDLAVGAFFRDRAKLFRAPLVRATIANDSRPRRGVLVGWNRGDIFALDDFYRSVGFYLAVGTSIDRIDIEVPVGGESFSPSLLRLYVSDDNQHWEELTEGLTIQNLEYGERVVYQCNFSLARYRYWKINFASAARTRSAQESLDRMVVAYSHEPPPRGVYGSLEYAE
jgi:hypothetical protein